MFKRSFSVLILLLVVSSSFAQESVRSVTKFTILNPGFSYERKLGVKSTFVTHAFLSTSGYYMYSDALGTSAGIFFDPAISLQYRKYYNFSRRHEKGKRTAMNSLNYIGPVWQTHFSKNYELGSSTVAEAEARFIHKIGFVWGMQRNYKSRFSLDLNVGPAIVFGNQSFSNNRGVIEKELRNVITIIAQVSIGFWLNKQP